jgi:hypothetical protein
LPWLPYAYGQAMYGGHYSANEGRPINFFFQVMNDSCEVQINQFPLSSIEEYAFVGTRLVLQLLTSGVLMITKL